MSGAVGPASAVGAVGAAEGLDAAERAPRWDAPRGEHVHSTPLRLSGPLLSAATFLSGLPGTGAAVRAVVTEVLGIRALTRLPDAYGGELPDDARPVAARAPRRWDAAGLPPPVGGGGPRSAREYLEVYTSGRLRPDEVAERALAALGALARRSPPMNVLAACEPEAVLAEARASAERFASGRPRALEGVPYLAKDQHDVAGLPTRFGSGHTPLAAERDATLVARLRAAGAVVLGKSVMTEWGVNPIGTNVHVTLPRNPHVTAHAAGGSSTGSAVAVALGIGPFATGGDAGGSVRTPAAWSGLFGLKPTFGRISRAGEASGGSLSHIGAIAVGVDDLVRFLDVVSSGPDPADGLTEGATFPEGGFGARLGDGVRGLRIGIEETEWADASPEVVSVCREALAGLEREGAKLVAVRVPLARHAAALGIATIGCEGVARARSVTPEERAHLALDIRVAMNVAAGVSAAEYLQVQRLRVGLRRQTAAALRSVDVLALPVLPIAAPRLPASAYDEPFSDAKLLLSICRHNFLANLTGLPAASAPVGVDPHGIPIGLQLVADAWDEAGLLAVLAHLERTGLAGVRRARGVIDLLSDAL